MHVIIFCIGSRKSGSTLKISRVPIAGRVKLGTNGFPIQTDHWRLWCV